MNGKSTYGLRLDQMANLLALGAERPEAGPEHADDEALRNLLQEQLTCAEPKGSLLRETLMMMLESLDPLRGKPLGEFLLDPQSDLDLVRAIKDCSKTLSCALDSADETALARTVYFAAIAGALVHHDTKITQSSYQTLDASLTTLIEKPWMAPQLVELFCQAREICRRRSESE